MVDIHGGCDRCGRLSNNSLDSYERYGCKLYCSECEDKYYSISSIRDNKIDYILSDIRLSKFNTFKFDIWKIFLYYFCYFINPF